LWAKLNSKNGITKDRTENPINDNKLKVEEEKNQNTELTVKVEKSDKIEEESLKAIKQLKGIFAITLYRNSNQEHCK